MPCRSKLQKTHQLLPHVIDPEAAPEPLTQLPREFDKEKDSDTEIISASTWHLCPVMADHPTWVLTPLLEKVGKGEQQQRIIISCMNP